MIIKSSARGAGAQLAAHLLRRDQNEIVVVRGGRHLIADDVAATIGDFELMARGAETTKPLYHVMMNPDQRMSVAQWSHAWSRYETEFGLHDQPYIEVEHHKKGRVHRHRVYYRIADDGTAIRANWSKIRNEKISRILEFELSHPLTPGAHTRSVCARLRDEGRHDVVNWINAGGARVADRPVASMRHGEQQQQDRTGIDAKAVRAAIYEAWCSTSSGIEFNATLATHGLELARGDKPGVWVAVDVAGGIHALSRAISQHARDAKIDGPRARSADLRARLDPINRLIPSVDDARARQQATFVRAIEALAEQPAPTLTRDVHAQTQTPVPPPSQPESTPVRLTEPSPRPVLSAPSPRPVQSRPDRRARATEARARLASIAAADADQARRDRYKVRLLEEAYGARIPDSLAPSLRWVRARPGAGEIVVQLRSGARVRDTGDRIRSSDVGSDAALGIMIAAARARGWTEVTIGGSPVAQARIAQALARAGIGVVDPSPEVAAIMAATRAEMDTLPSRRPRGRSL